MDAFPYAAARPDTEVDIGALVRTVVSELSQDEAHSGTLPPRAYLSRRFFDLERERLFRSGWVAVAHVSQAEAGAEIPLFGENIVTSRDEEGRIATIAQSADGSSRTVRHEVAHGFVYVNLAGDALPLEPQLAGLAPKFARLRLDDLVPAFQMDYESGFNWKIMAETFMECYHHAGAHRDTFEVDFPTRLARVGEHSDAWTSGFATAHDKVPDENMTIGLTVLANDFDQLERRSFFLYHIYPNQLIATMLDRVIWFRNQPVGPAETRLQVFVLVRPEARDLPGYREAISAEYAFFDAVNAQDLAANESQQLGLASVFAEPGRFSHLEGSLWHFATYVRARIAGRAVRTQSEGNA